MKKLCIFLCLLLPLFLFAACADDEQAPDETSGTAVNDGIKIDLGDAVTIGVNETKQLTALSRKDNSMTTVIWSSSDSSVVAVNYDGLLTGIADGTAVITATTPNEAYTATCTVTVSSVLTNIVFENANVDMEKGAEITLTPILTPANITNVSLTWMSDNPKVATVTDGVVKAVGNGSTSIIVSDETNMHTAVCTVTVTTTVTGVTLDVESDTIQMDKGDTRTLVAAVIPADASDPTLTWSSSMPDIVEVSADGTITAKAGGAANITVTTVNGIVASCTVVVNSPVVGITLDQTEVVLGVGETLQLVATIDPADANLQDVSWGCSDLSVVNVDNTGALLGLKTGTVEVTVTTIDGNLTATCTVTVINAATEITFDAEGGDLELGKMMQLIPILTPEDADPPVLTWVSSDPTIATVDEYGNVTALALGETVITATATNGVTATYNLRVVELEIKIEKIVMDEILSVKVASTFNIGISLLPNNCTEGYVITSLDPTMIRVNSDGSLTPLKAGATTVVVSSKSGSVSASCVVSVDALTDAEREALSQEYAQKDAELLQEHNNNIASITAKYDAQLAKIDEIIAKLSISSETEYNTKRADLSTRLADAQAALDQAVLDGDQQMIAVHTATRDALQEQINNLDKDWTTLSLLLKNRQDNLTAKSNELSNEDARYLAAQNKLKAEYAFLF
ncbi:MAG: Ig-like domain-containing protein [Clostridia bacterium]|nr:Ig-like domain-containing protein [Clostridia bacterium]